jgi:hypothetical protein
MLLLGYLGKICGAEELNETQTGYREEKEKTEE